MFDALLEFFFDVWLRVAGIITTLFLLWFWLFAPKYTAVESEHQAERFLKHLRFELTATPECGDGLPRECYARAGEKLLTLTCSDIACWNLEIK